MNENSGPDDVDFDNAKEKWNNKFRGSQINDSQIDEDDDSNLLDEQIEMTQKSQISKTTKPETEANLSQEELDEYNNGLAGLSQNSQKSVSDAKRTFMIRKLLLDRFPNIKLEKKDPLLECKYQPSRQEITEQILDCRDNYLNDIHSRIEQFNRKQKIINMQKLSKHDFDGIEEVPSDFGPENQELIKLDKWKTAILKVEKTLTLRNIMILAIITYFTWVIIIPESLYIINLYDSEYFGYFNERAPRLAKTTNQRLYFQRHNIPYYLLDDLNADYIMERERKAAGLPPKYMEQYGDNPPTMPAHVRVMNSLVYGKDKIMGTAAAAHRRLRSLRGLQNGEPPGDAPTVVDPFPGKPVVDAQIRVDEKQQFQPHMPAQIMSDSACQSGGFFIYLFGILYCFLGISLVTQNYINPAIDTIKKKGIIGSDTMNATLLAFSNSAAESFIVMNSIFMKVPDIGIQTAVQQTAFYSLIIQGLFYLYAEEGTRIDWWISTRDTSLFIVYLTIMSIFMVGNKIENYAIIVLNIIYFIHIFLMKLNYTYEVAIKKHFASFLEIRELNRLAKEDISHFHNNLDSRHPSIEILNKIEFKQEGDVLIFPMGSFNKSNGTTGQFMAKQSNTIRYRMKPIQRVKIREERFATPDNTSLMARARMKRAVIKILTKLQAYNFFEKMKRNKKCIIPVTKFIKDYHSAPQGQFSSFQEDNFNTAEIYQGKNYLDKSESDEEIESELVDSESERSEEFDPSVDMSGNDEEAREIFGGDDDGAKEPVNFLGEGIKNAGHKKDHNNMSSDRFNMKKSPKDQKVEDLDEDMMDEKLDWQQIFLQEKMMGEPQTIPQSIIYQLVNETINKDGYSTKIPSGLPNILWYVFCMPLTHTQYITIPDPLSKRNSNYYPVTIIMAVCWIWAYCFVIVWFTYMMSVCLKLPFSILPMFIYPFAVSIRDRKKFQDFKISLSVFNKELPDQEITLAETYAPQIFQMTGCAGFSWFLYTNITDEDIVFSNETIQFQVPLLIIVISIKYCILMYNRFKTRKALWKANVYGYIIFIVMVLIVDYQKQLFGEG